MSEDPKNSKLSGTSDRDASPLFLVVLLAVGLVVVALALWVIFGSPASDQHDAAGGERRRLSREEFTVIVADDDADTSETQPETRRPGQDEPRRSPENRSPNEPRLEPRGSEDSRAGTKGQPGDAGNRK